MSINPSVQSSLVKTFFLALIITLSACSKSEEKAATDTKANKPVSAPSAKSYASGAPPANRGIVKEIHQAGGYSYIETDINGSIYWIATTISSIKPNEEISWNDYAIMPNFTSKALNKTFKQILFIDRVQSASNAPVSNEHSGTVIEALNSAGYTYIQVSESGKNVWLAAPVTDVVKGQSISWSSGSPMQNFSSRSLDRTFATIFFVGGINKI